ncbi:unnamed protein product [Allacma fusca]|uniref:Uncharacterized protein n=1 Tax=Allacma fusca TaxID=39272 RepID=A0A8J2L9T0_9HEXA|nr:unnamed protein product [Allacma fusca]
MMSFFCYYQASGLPCEKNDNMKKMYDLALKINEAKPNELIAQSIHYYIKQYNNTKPYFKYHCGNLLGSMLYEKPDVKLKPPFEKYLNDNFKDGAKDGTGKMFAEFLNLADQAFQKELNY